MKPAGILAFGAGVIVLSVWWELSLWHECRVDHSFFYCVRVLGQ